MTLKNLFYQIQIPKYVVSKILGLRYSACQLLTVKQNHNKCSSPGGQRNIIIEFFKIKSKAIRSLKQFKLKLIIFLAFWKSSINYRQLSKALPVSFGSALVL